MSLEVAIKVPIETDAYVILLKFINEGSFYIKWIEDVKVYYDSGISFLVY